MEVGLPATGNLQGVFRCLLVAGGMWQCWLNILVWWWSGGFYHEETLLPCKLHLHYPWDYLLNARQYGVHGATLALMDFWLQIQRYLSW